MMDPKHLKEIRDMIYIEFADYAQAGEDKVLLHEILVALKKYSDYLERVGSK